MDNRISKIINLYRNSKRKQPDRCIEFTKQQRTLADAIRIATLSIDADGKRHPHQYRRTQHSLDEWHRSVLKKASEIKKANSFHTLLKILESVKVRDIGALTKYDTATRLGTYLNLYPDRIYLHAGTRVGAERLIGKIKGKTIRKVALPEAFHREDLQYWEIEDILCIFKKAFRSTVSAKQFESLCLQMTSTCQKDEPSRNCN